LVGETTCDVESDVAANTLLAFGAVEISVVMAGPPSHFRYRSEPTAISAKNLQKFTQVLSVGRADASSLHVSAPNKREIIKDHQ
jgi:hypothetical protein